MSINISINKNSENAILSLSENGVIKNRTISVSDLISNLSVLKPTEEDSGYLPKRLIRKIIRSNTILRYYHFEEFKTTVSTVCDVEVKDNPYGIRSETVDNNTYIVFPEFSIKNIVGIIENNNNESHNSTRYKVMVCQQDLLGIHDSIKTTDFFPNHFANYICWPKNFDFNAFLSSRDGNIQSSFITQYFSNRFNNDLLPRISNPFEKMDKDLLEEFKNFLNEIFNSQDFIQSFIENFAERSLSHHRFLWYYFISNIKNQNPLNYLESSLSLKEINVNYFNQRRVEE